MSLEIRHRSARHPDAQYRGLIVAEMNARKMPAPDTGLNIDLPIVEFVPAEVEQDEMDMALAWLAAYNAEEAERAKAEQDAIFAHEMEGILPTWGEHFSPEDIQWGFSVRTRA